jgi:hypothetical protein
MKLPAEDPSGWDGPSRTVQTLVDAVAGRSSPPTWDDACRAMDIAESIDSSLRAGRAVDVFNHPCTEENSFKAVMAIGALGALALTFLAVVVLAIAESLDIRLLKHPAWRQLWPLILLAMLAVFLALQSLRWLFPGSSQ